MPRYIFVYLGGEYPTDPGEAHKHLEKYQGWLQSLGDKVVSPAIPFKDTHVVRSPISSEPGSLSAMSGLSIFEFPSMPEAVAAAQGCPFLEIGGSLEISEMIDMNSAEG
jgi:hypothetical protein